MHHTHAQSANTRTCTCTYTHTHALAVAGELPGPAPKPSPAFRFVGRPCWCWSPSALLRRHDHNPDPPATPCPTQSQHPRPRLDLLLRVHVLAAGTVHFCAQRRGQTATSCGGRRGALSPATRTTSEPSLRAASVVAAFILEELAFNASCSVLPSLAGGSCSKHESVLKGINNIQMAKGLIGVHTISRILSLFLSFVGTTLQLLYSCRNL